jgi:hypothetical protein
MLGQASWVLWISMTVLMGDPGCDGKRAMILNRGRAAVATKCAVWKAAPGGHFRAVVWRKRQQAGVPRRSCVAQATDDRRDRT